MSRAEKYLSDALQAPTEFITFDTYDELVRALTSNRIAAAWAPPFVCARLEVMGLPVLLRAIRHGAATYRAALLVRPGTVISVEALRGATAAWTDRDSVAGYLLPMAWLRAQGKDAEQLLGRQEFVGTYRAGLEAVNAGRAFVTSIFASTTDESTGLDTVWPEKRDAFQVFGFTGESPNDGLATAANLSARWREVLRSVLVRLHETEAGTRILAECFQADRFESAPPLSYRALYRLTAHSTER